tara:strand:+ start:13882 stop:14772 length:891 start_codon:yes stop_codon:yes gene_type:complete
MNNNFINYSFKESNFSDLFRNANRAVLTHGIETQPRSLKIKELLNVSLTLENPRNRILASKIRKHSNAYACGELLWYLRGSESLEELAFYSKRLCDYSDDGTTLNSAYGNRIFGVHKDFPNQWENVIQKFVNDKDTRQSVININYAQDQNRVTKDVTCTLALQYLIRENKLHAITVMRSNDSFLGFLYDTFCFTMLQELMLIRLHEYKQFENLELGFYIHNVNSFHLYENYFDKAKLVCTEVCVSSDMQPIKSNRQLYTLQHDEQILRIENKKIDIDKYEKPWDWIATQLNRKIKK